MILLVHETRHNTTQPTAIATLAYGLKKYSKEILKPQKLNFFHISRFMSGTGGSRQAVKNLVLLWEMMFVNSGPKCSFMKEIKLIIYLDVKGSITGNFDINIKQKLN